MAVVLPVTVSPLLCLLYAHHMQSTAKVICAHPYVALLSLLTMAIIMTAGVVGVLAAADTETRHRKDAAKGT